MALINPKKKEVQVKLVYYGPGRGGKTTNLEYIYAKFKNRIKGNLTTIKTYGDRTLFFDFMPLDIGIIRGYNIKMQFYTVPGQVKYNATRRLVLRGVDGIVFVADSMALRRKMNIVSLKDLQDNLTTFDKSIFKIPLVLQYNKRDLADQGIPLLTRETLDNDLNRQLKVPSFEASAITGDNVVETMKKAISLTVASLEKKLELKG
ncbi:MAG: gliding motility protein [Desulfobacterales bacterium]|nr:gliding motility protein [Desulfobacterales bacterium]